jgi:hypothetical protein
MGGKKIKILQWKTFLEFVTDMQYVYSFVRCSKVLKLPLALKGVTKFPVNMIMRHFNHCLQIHEVFADALQIPEINIK